MRYKERKRQDKGESIGVQEQQEQLGVVGYQSVERQRPEENDGALTCASGVSRAPGYSKGSALTPLGEGKGSGGRHMSTHGTTVTTWHCVAECLPSPIEYTNIREYTGGGYPSETRCNPNPPLGSCHRTLSQAFQLSRINSKTVKRRGHIYIYIYPPRLPHACIIIVIRLSPHVQ